MNFDRLRHVAERADLGAEREALLAVEIPERPGSFLQFCEALGQRSITEFNYRFSGSERARVFVGFALGHGHDEADAVIAQLRGAGYTVLDMSGNEIAKLHVRYMVGGHAPGIHAPASHAPASHTPASHTPLSHAPAVHAAGTQAPGGDAAIDELLYRFEFPERPGALLRFLKSIGTSLEHQPVSLPQSRFRLRPGAGRYPGTQGRARGVPAAPAGAALFLYRRERERGLSDVPGAMTGERGRQPIGAAAGC